MPSYEFAPNRELLIEILRLHGLFLAGSAEGVKADLQGANLYGANLQGADLRRANLEGADLRRADLRRANLEGADLRRADLRRADLREADLYRAYLTSADLRGADLRRADLYRADLQGASLQGASLQGASLQGASLQGANLQGVIGLDNPPIPRVQPIITMPQFIEPTSPPTFHSSSSFQKNASQRFISVEIEVAKTANGANANTYNTIGVLGGAIVCDGSLPGGGFEINTPPAQGDIFVEQITKICEALKQDGAEVDKSCGLHVHVDTRDLDFYTLRKLAFLYQKLEPALFSIVAPSRRNSHYCAPCGDKLVLNLKNPGSFKKNKEQLCQNVYGRQPDFTRIKRQKYDNARYAALNLHSHLYRGTVENRMFNGTVNATKIINWGILNAAMIDFAYEASESEILALRTNPLQTLMLISPSNSVKEWVVDRVKKFNNGIVDID